MLRVLELFAGIGACSKALERLGIEHEIVDAVEIDKYAVASFNAVHGTNFEPQDICKWNKDIECDLIIYGSPCQDFSVAGKNAGGDEGSGTRSSLLYESLRIIDNLRPKYVIWENVKNLLSKKHIHNWNAYAERMEEMGYKNYCQVLNAKDYGVPQNRERVFTVSILGDGGFKFPARKPLTKRLKDVLEPEVDEKYYLSDKAIAGYVAHTERHRERGNGFKFEPNDGDVVAHTISTKAGQRTTDNCIKIAGKLDIKGQDQIKRVYETGGISPTLSTMQGGNRQPKIVASRGRGKNNEQHLEPRKDGLTNTITSVQKDNYVAKDYRIRKLTPKECWRLMGFDDADYEKAAKVNSNTQLYKQAGNSIVVNVLEAILKELLCK